MENQQSAQIEFQSRGRDLLIGNRLLYPVLLILKVSVPWSGFINRKPAPEVVVAHLTPVSVPWSGFINRKKETLKQSIENKGFSPVVGIY